MNKIIHNENLIQYEFIEKLDRVTYNTSVFLWLVGKKAVMIDSGYYKFAISIQEDLLKNGIEVEKIIVTHYHRDHAEGSILFKEADIIASSKYSENFHKCQRISRKDLKYKKPTILVNNEFVFNFYGSILKLIETPGHTPCGLSVLIDDDYLYVSDMLLEDIDGKMIVPYIDLNSDPNDHISTLKRYYDLNPKHLLLTHGKAKFDVDLDNQLKERLYYLEHFINDDFNSNLESCLLKDLDQYAMTEIHKLNKRNAKKYVSAQATSYI